jgi:formamidopyrimidine-DNA glycosylase
MPELPDLEVFAGNLEKKLKGKKLKALHVKVSKKLNVTAASLKKKLEGQSIKKVFREGKELYFEFSGGDILALHLMLHGGLEYFEKKNEAKHTIIELEFDDDSGLALTDWQGMATPTLNPLEKKSPDALSPEVNFAWLKKALQKRTVIKTLLMDQKTIRGIGNAYADEILWDAGISPFSVANKIPDGKIKALAKSVKKVLKDAEKQIKKKNPDTISGELRDFLPIHNASKKKSPEGVTIQHKLIGGRKTYFTDEQELFE